MWRHLFACANPDPLQHRRGQLLAGVLLGLLVIASFAFVRGLQEPARPLLVSALLGLGLFVVAGLYLLNRRGAVLAASWGLLLTLIALVTSLALQAAALPTAVINPLFLVLPVGLAGVFLSSRTALAVTTFVILDTAWLYSVGVPGLAPLRTVPSTAIAYLIINATILFIATGLFTWGSGYLVQQALHGLQQAHRLLQVAQEHERKRLIRDLHDGPLQEIAGITKLAEQCQVLLAAGDVDATQAVLQLLQTHGQLVSTQLRTLATDLGPPELLHTDLGTALQNLATRAQGAGVTVTVQNTLVERLPPSLETTIFRLVQEGLTNVIKHAHAQHAWIQLWCRNRVIHLQIQDDGHGFVPDHGAALRDSIQHLGLEGMAERIAAVGGYLTIRSAPMRGSTLQFVLPLLPNHPTKVLFQEERPHHPGRPYDDQL